MSKNFNLPQWTNPTISRPAYIAYLYGFLPAQTLELPTVPKTGTIELAERTRIFNFYVEQNMIAGDNPVMMSYELPFKKSRRKKTGSTEIGLEIIGSDEAICDALMIQSVYAILEDAGYKKLSVRINTLGDKESVARFERELANYFRKNISNIPASFRQLFKKDIWSIPQQDDKAIEEFLTNAPQTIGALSETSRKRFKDVLEYLEHMQVPYSVDTSLIMNKQFASQTIFEITSEDEPQKILATGYRYDGLSKRLGIKQNIPGIYAELAYKAKNAHKPKIRKGSEIVSPLFFFVQIGNFAKVKSIETLHLLQKSDIVIGHALAKDKITAQMMSAERMRVPYILIMGQKEAADRVVLVRDSVSRSQQTVPLESLPAHLEKLIPKKRPLKKAVKKTKKK